MISTPGDNSTPTSFRQYIVVSIRTLVLLESTDGFSVPSVALGMACRLRKIALERVEIMHRNCMGPDYGSIGRDSEPMLSRRRESTEVN